MQTIEYADTLRVRAVSRELRSLVDRFDERLRSPPEFYQIEIDRPGDVRAKTLENISSCEIFLLVAIAL